MYQLHEISPVISSTPCSSRVPAGEHFDLVAAVSRNHWINPARSDNDDVHVDELHYKMMLEQLCGAAPAGHGGSTQKPIIYTVPRELKINNYNPVAEYEPAAVCLGSKYFELYNPPTESQCRDSLEQLDIYKWSCVQQLIRRHSCLLEPAKTLVLLHGCLTAMKLLVPNIRASYSRGALNTEGVHPDDEVAKMMMLDGCFILHRLLKYARRAKMEAGGRSDRCDDEDWTQVYGKCFVWELVTRDLLLLENQIPFFVIQELFQQLKNEDEHQDLLVTGGLRLFRSLRPQRLHRSPIACSDVHHLLHLFYLSVSFPQMLSYSRQYLHHHQREELLSEELPQWIPCAKELEEAGVRFRRKKNATSFLHVTFARGVPEIPQLELNDSSESSFRNLIAFEQTYPHTPRDVSTYAVFMDCLVTSPEDMRILNLHGILVSHLNSRSKAWRFFGDIVRQVHWSADNYLAGLMNEVNRYRNRRRHKWRAALARNYFSNPWVTMSVVAAVVLLLMSGLQTFFAVYAYFKPPK